MRPLAVADVDDVVALYADPTTARFLGEIDRGEALARLHVNEREWRELGYGRTAIVERATGRFIGRGGLRYWPQFGETEAGWALTPDARGQGYATEASQAAIDWGFAQFGFPYITAMVHPENDASRAVAERLGMEPIRDDNLEGDPVTVYARTAPASPPQPHRPGAS